MSLASILTAPLEVAATWLAAMGLISGNAAFLALVSGEDDEGIAAALARGVAVGFAHGFVWAVLAAAVLAATE